MNDKETPATEAWLDQRLGLRVRKRRHKTGASSRERIIQDSNMVDMHEADLHAGLIAWLRKHHLIYIHHRMDRASGIAVGFPDFTVIHCGRAWLCELKTLTGHLSVKQKEVIAELQANGTPVLVARSIEEAISGVQTWLGIQNDGEAHRAGNEASVGIGDILSGKTGIQNLFIGTIGGRDYVLSGDSGAGGSAAIVRWASVEDIREFPRR